MAVLAGGMVSVVAPTESDEGRDVIPDFVKPEIQFAINAFEEHVVSGELEFAVKALDACTDLFSVQAHVTTTNLADAVDQAASFGCKSDHSRRLRDIASAMLAAPSVALPHSR